MAKIVVFKYLQKKFSYFLKKIRKREFPLPVLRFKKFIRRIRQNQLAFQPISPPNSYIAGKSESPLKGIGLYRFERELKPCI